MGRETKRARRAPPLQKFGKEKGPEPKFEAFVILSRRRPTFPHSYPCSIIGPARLNFRVRDGNGCDPRGMTTGNSKKFSVFRSKFSVSEKLEPRELRKLSEKIGAARLGAADNSLGWRYKFGPLPNNYCVLQDVASGLETSLQ